MQGAVGGRTVYTEGHVAEFGCKQFTGTVGIPLHIALQATLNGASSEPIPIFYDNGRVLDPDADDILAKPDVSTSTTNTWFQPLMVNYFEQFKGEVKAKFGAQLQWPAEWQMGAIVRNALAHNGKVHITDATRPPVTWGGLTLSSTDHGVPIFNRHMSVGDLLMLMIAMEEARIGQSLDRRWVAPRPTISLDGVYSPVAGSPPDAEDH